MLAYMRDAKKDGTDPKYAIKQAESILRELKNRDYPDPSYITEKCDKIIMFLKEFGFKSW